MQPVASALGEGSRRADVAIASALLRVVHRAIPSPSEAAFSVEFQAGALRIIPRENPAPRSVRGGAGRVSGTR